MVKTNWVVIFLVLLIAACNPNNKHDDVLSNEFKIINPQFIKSAKLSELIDSKITYKTLQSDSNNQLGEIEKLIFKKDNIYALDSHYALKLLRFNSDGKLLNVIGKVGEGIGEYENLTEAYINDSIIEIIDRDNFSRLKYNFNGEFIKEERIDFYISQAMPFGNNRRIFYSPTDYTISGNESEGVLMITNSDYDRVLKAYFPYEEVFDDASLPGFLIGENLEFTYVKPGLGEFYKIDSTMNVKPYFKIDFGPYKWPLSKEQIQADQENSEKVFFKGNVMSLVHRLSETDNYLTFLTVMCSPEEEAKQLDLIKHRWFCIYDKRKVKLYIIKKIINDIDGGLFANPIVGTGNTFTGVLSPEELIDYFKEESAKDNASKDLKKLVDSLTFSSNPVLMQYSLKDNIIL
ncbi:MAG: hypothetical protein ACI9C9_002793 [Marivirga sp.]|jgi:hypothetical protein